jgi:hypothetical protein
MFFRILSHDDSDLNFYLVDSTGACLRSIELTLIYECLVSVLYLSWSVAGFSLARTDRPRGEATLIPFDDITLKYMVLRHWCSSIPPLIIGYSLRMR